MLQRYWIIELAMLALVVGVALWRGRPAERWTAAIWACATVLSPLVENMHARHGPNTPILAVDAGTAFCFTVVALRYAHWWSIWVAGVAVFQLLVHAAMIAKTGIPIHGYYLALEIAGDFITLGLGAGILIGISRRDSVRTTA